MYHSDSKIIFVLLTYSAYYCTLLYFDVEYIKRGFSFRTQIASVFPAVFLSKRLGRRVPAQSLDYEALSEQEERHVTRDA